MSEQRIAEQLLEWADEIEKCAEGAHAGINATIQEMRNRADALSASPADTGHLVGRNGVIEERECVACHQSYPAYSAESVMRCYQCRAAETGRASETSGKYCGAEGWAKGQPHGVFVVDAERDEPYVCSLVEGHIGHHVAEDIYGNVKGCWPAPPPSASSAQKGGE